MTTDTLQQLRPLLHDGEVGTEIGVEHIIEPQLTQRCDHLPGHQRPRLQSELLSQRSTYGRRCLHDDRLIWICQRTNDTVGMIHLRECTGGTDRDTLPAVGAG